MKERSWLLYKVRGKNAILCVDVVEMGLKEEDRFTFCEILRKDVLLQGCIR